MALKNPISNSSTEKRSTDALKHLTGSKINIFHKFIRKGNESVSKQTANSFLSPKITKLLIWWKISDCSH
jgi:hypothetical protein